jgi:hypothetical protein
MAFAVVQVKTPENRDIFIGGHYRHSRGNSSEREFTEPAGISVFETLDEFRRVDHRKSVVVPSEGRVVVNLDPVVPPEPINTPISAAPSESGLPRRRT